MADEMYFEATPSSRSRPSTATLTLPDLTVDLVTDRGVFSTDRIDPGTKFLLLEAPHPPAAADHLLDLGCGYGPIAVALATRAPDAAVWAVDVNERALELCADNADRLGLDGISPRAPEAVADDLRFDAIYSNPPIRIGKAKLHELLVAWLARLVPDGRAYLVVHKHLGADSLAAWLGREGHPTRRLGSREGYRLLESGPAR